MSKRLSKFFLVVLAALALRACVIEPVKLTDDSMAPILVNGDVALVSKLRYGIRVPGAGAMLIEWAQPQKGDLVVAVSVGDPPVNLLRRISHIPGDEVTLPDGRRHKLLDGEFYLAAEQKEEAMDSSRMGVVLRRSIIGKATHTWIAKKSSNNGQSQVESEKSSWRIFQPIL